MSIISDVLISLSLSLSLSVCMLFYCCAHEIKQPFVDCTLWFFSLYLSLHFWCIESGTFGYIDAIERHYIYRNKKKARRISYVYMTIYSLLIFPSLFLVSNTEAYVVLLQYQHIFAITYCFVLTLIRPCYNFFLPPVYSTFIKKSGGQTICAGRAHTNPTGF